MNKKQKIDPISVAGGYWTGSSAVVDLLSEHISCKVIPNEFSFFSFGQFFEEIVVPLKENNLNIKHLNSHIARMKDFNRSDLRPLRPILRKILMLFRFYPKLLFNQRTNMYKFLNKDYQSYCNLLFKELEAINSQSKEPNIAALEHNINNLLCSAAGAKSSAEQESVVKYGVFDQLIAPPYIEHAMKSINNMKYINVDREWRDQYISLRDRYFNMTQRNEALGIRPFAESHAHKHDSPIDFMIDLRNRIDNVKNKQLAQKNKNILWVSYEEVVLNTNATAKKIFDFLDIDFQHWSPNQKFFPEKSALRINKWKNKTWAKEPYVSEIQKINESLKY